MASQPANTTIAVEREVRAYRQDLRHEAVLSLVGFPGLRPLVMSIPGGQDSSDARVDETLIDATRDGSTLVTTSVDEQKTGLPVVRFLKTVTTFEDAAEGMSDLQFPIRIGRDAFLRKTSGNLTDDLHQELRDV